MANAALVALVRVPDAATNVYPLPDWSMLRSAKVAMPSLAFTVVVPASVAPLGFVPRVSVTGSVLFDTVFPKASSIATATPGAIGWARSAKLGGWPVKPSFAAPAGVMVNVALVAVVSEPEEATSVYPLPALSIDRPGKLATPFTVLTVFVPESVPPLGFVAIATVTPYVGLGTALPKASSIATAIAGVSASPAVPSFG